MACTVNGTSVIYNGVEIVDVLTDEVSQEVVYDQSGVDPIAVRVLVRVTGYVHLSSNPGVGIRKSGDLATAMQEVQAALLMPRRTFEMKLGDQTWLACVPYAVERCATYNRPNYSTDWDVENGPKPSLRVLAIIGQYAMKIAFTVSFTKSICDDPLAASLFKGLMHLRFWINDDIDCTNWTLTRTYQGTIRFYGAIPVADGQPLHQNQIARAFAIPPLQWGFQRKRISISEDPSGLWANFQVVDQEVWAVAPAPATDWEGHFEVTTPMGGITCESECQVTVRGGKMTPKWNLLRLVIRILEAKLQLNQVPMRYLLLSMTLREPLHLNEVTGHARVKHLGNENIQAPTILGVFMANSDTWFKPFPMSGPNAINLAGLAPQTHVPYHFEHGYQGSSPDGVNTVLYAPNSLLGLLLPALQTPCCPVWLSNINLPGYVPYPGNPDQTPGADEGTEQSYNQSPGQMTTDSARTSPGHQDSWYWNTRLTSEYKTFTGLGAFPRAVAADDSTKATLSIIRMHAPIQFREIRMEFYRSNAWPTLPKPKEQWTDEATGIKHSLLGWRLIPNGSSLTSDKKGDVRSVAMVMHYALDRPVDWEAGEAYPVGCLPDRLQDVRNFQELPSSEAAKIFVDPENIIGVVVSETSPATPTDPK